MQSIHPKYEFPVEGRSWTRGALPVAGVFFLDGGCHIVARHGPAEQDLVARGALMMAVVRFDGEPDEGRRAGGPLLSLAPREAVARFSGLASPAGARPARGTPARIRPPFPADDADPHGDP